MLLVVLAVAEASPGCAGSSCGSSETLQVLEGIKEGEAQLAQMGAPRPCGRVVVGSGGCKWALSCGWTHARS